MKTHTMTSLMMLSLLFSCASCKPPKIKTQERCVVSFDFNYGTQKEIDEFFEYIDDYKYDPELRKQFLKDVTAIFGKSRCHQYSLMRVARTSEARDKPLSYANNNIGFSAKTWLVRITPWANETKAYQSDRCGKWRPEDGY